MHNARYAGVGVRARGRGACGPRAATGHPHRHRARVHVQLQALCTVYRVHTSHVLLLVAGAREPGRAFYQRAVFCLLSLLKVALGSLSPELPAEQVSITQLHQPARGGRGSRRVLTILFPWLERTPGRASLRGAARRGVRLLRRRVLGLDALDERFYEG